MYLQCVEILAKFRIAKFGIRALLIQNRNERGERKYGQVPQKLLGEKESGNTSWIFHWRSLCVRSHVYVHVCLCVCVHVCIHVCAHVHMCIRILSVFISSLQPNYFHL